MRHKIQNQNPNFTLNFEEKLPYFFEKDGLEMKSSYTESDSKVLKRNQIPQRDHVCTAWIILVEG